MSNDFYIEIHNFFGINGKKAISDKEKLKIIELFPLRLPIPNSVDHINPAKMIYDVPVRKYIGPLDDKSVKKEIQILKDDDEYYYIIVYSKVKSITGFVQVRSHYKCDQWDGLTKCIEDKIMVKVK